MFGSDLDGNGYGCGILFINYLRSQLGYTLEAICQAGGSTFADHYKNLTGRTDDPLVAMSALLESHFDGYSYNVLKNNPFPLYDRTSRLVELGYTFSVENVPTLARVLGHVAHVRPFFTCPEKDYSFHIAHRAVTWTVTATAVGFGVPRFIWSVNGTELPSPSGERDEALAFDVPDPNQPQTPKKASGDARFRWSYSDQFSRDATENVLVITNESFDGVYHLGISVSVAETLVADAATNVTSSLTFEAKKVVYEANYYSDLIKCATRLVSEVPRLEKTIDLIPHGPDPNPQFDLARTIRAVDDIRDELRRIGETNPQLALQATEYAATRLQVEPGLLAGRREIPI